MTCTYVDAPFDSAQTETTCTACGCSATTPSNSVLSYIIEYSTRMVHGGGGGGGGVREIYIQYVFRA